MPIYPGAVYRRPPNMTTSGKRARTDGVILHVDAGDVRDLYGWWNNPANGGNGSHFHVAKDGTVFQYADTDLVVWTSRTGSRRTVGIETQGKAVGEWTPAQLAALEGLVGWLCETYSIPKRAMRTSSDVGIGWHRLGVPRSKGATVSRTGGELWAADYSKVCPGPDREAQIPDLIKRIAGQTSGVLKPGTGATITPTPSPEEDDMIILYSGKYPSGVAFIGGGISILRTAEEKANLVKAGAREAWVEDLTLSELISSARGKYTNVATRQG